MASRYYGLDKGQTQINVVDGLSTNSTDFEFVVDLAQSPSREMAVLALDAIKNRILAGTWPPAAA